MRIIVELFGRVRGIELSLLQGRIATSEPEAEEEYEQVPHDPHSTTGCQAERRMDYEDLAGKQKFGFHGRET